MPGGTVMNKYVVFALCVGILTALVFAMPILNWGI